MANDKIFKVKNGILAQRYLQSAGAETAGSVGYNLAGAVYDIKSFSVASQETTPQKAEFKSDGTKMYVIGSASDAVHQYSLSTAWDVSSAAYDSVSFSVATQSAGPVDLVFGLGGTKMYVLNASNDTIYQYTLSTAWDISTASYDSKTFAVTSQETLPYGITFKPDGTTMYAVGTTSDTVFQYTLSTAWDISTASYASKSLSVGAQATQPRALTFKSDGTHVLVICPDTDAVYQYNFSTPWDVSTGSYSGVSFSVTSQLTAPLGLTYGNDGLAVYVVDSNSPQTIYQYSTASYTQTLDLSTGTYFSFTPSGATEVSFTNPPAAGLAIGFAVEINGDGSAITWPASVKWHEATAPTATASKEIYTFITTDGGTTYYGKQAATELA